MARQRYIAPPALGWQAPLGAKAAYETIMGRERTHVKTCVCGSFIPRVVRHAAHYGRRDATAAASASLPAFDGIAIAWPCEARSPGCLLYWLWCRTQAQGGVAQRPCVRARGPGRARHPSTGRADRVSPPPVRHLAGSIRGSRPSGPGRRGSCRWLSRSGSPRIPPPWGALLTLRGSSRSWTHAGLTELRRSELQ
jgi:hypothetical protein